MQYLAAKLNLMILDTLYTEGVEMQLLVPDTQYAAFIKEVTEASNGKVVPESEDFVMARMWKAKRRYLMPEYDI